MSEQYSDFSRGMKRMSRVLVVVSAADRKALLGKALAALKN